MKLSIAKAVSICLSFVILCCFSPQCFAHKLRLFAWQEGEQILGEAKFPSGRGAKDIEVIALDSQQKQVQTTRTDEAGNFSLSLPDGVHGQLEIIANAGDGHRASWKIDLVEETAASASQPQKQAVASKETTDKPEAASQKLPPQGQGVNEERLTVLIETSLEKKLGPIRKELAEIREDKVSLQDILGGLGYIFGLAGIATYMKYRKKEKE